MLENIHRIFQESIQVKEKTLQSQAANIVKAVKIIAGSLKNKGTIFFFGNGGSAADSQHIAAELIGRFQKERKSLAAIALTTDSSILTCLSNDYGYDVIFSRQLEGLAAKGDVAVGISTSGHSTNVVEGIKKARKMGLKTIVLTGLGGGRLRRLADVTIDVPSKNTARIQESHICIGHAICELVEMYF